MKLAKGMLPFVCKVSTNAASASASAATAAKKLYPG